MQIRFLGWEDALEEGMATHFSILAWRMLWTEEPGGLQSIGQQESDTTQILRLKIIDTVFLVEGLFERFSRVVSD